MGPFIIGVVLFIVAFIVIISNIKLINRASGTKIYII